MCSVNAAKSRFPFFVLSFKVAQSWAPDIVTPGADSHPVNAILNYAYAVLESEVRIEVISEGYDHFSG
jgi:CRISPR/Cas system-associated endonuclease Cas1